MKSGGNMHAGMRNKSPSASDKSTQLPGKSIDKDPTRSGTAATPKTLGPRTA